MSEIFRVNGWRVHDTGRYYRVFNVDNDRVDYRRNYDGTGEHLRYKVRIPITIERVLEREIANRTSAGRTYGIEIECYHPNNYRIREEVAEKLTQIGIPCRFRGYTHEVTDEWKVVTDSSIRGGVGLEVVSPPLRGEAGMETLEKVLKVLRDSGCKVNRSTGLHVHQYAKDLTSNQIQNCFNFYRDNEDLIDRMLAPSRRGNNNTYCRSLIIESERGSLPRVRYTKLNYQSYIKYGTLEFRQHQGTLSYTKIKKWVEFTKAVIEETASYSRAFNTPLEMLVYLRLDPEWYQRRIRRLGGVA